jgi:hypothetical protein
MIKLFEVDNPISVKDFCLNPQSQTFSIHQQQKTPFKPKKQKNHPSHWRH